MLLTLGATSSAATIAFRCEVSPVVLVAQQKPAPDELERLRAMLTLTGPDGRDARETAVERLLGMARPEAHQLLVQHLRPGGSADGLRATILTALQRHLLATPAAQFGGAAGPQRQSILVEYLRELSLLWRDVGPLDDASGDPTRGLARTALQRVPPRELEAAARALLAGDEAPPKVAVLRCLADMQQMLLAGVIAEQLEARDQVVRQGARDALQLLTCHPEPIETIAQFESWRAANGELRYVDLVERAARLGSRPLARMREELARLRVDAAREVVRAHVTRAPGIDWAAVQSRVVVDDPTVLDACLELLQQTLPSTTVNGDGSAARQAFCRALVQRYRQVAPDQVQRRAMLLEVAAYLGRPEETELATELVGLLLAQLDGADVPSRLAALRGLRRYPATETRARLVALAQALLPGGAETRTQLATILGTLTSRATPRWSAPSPSDVDREAWIALTRALCRSDAELGLRDAALTMVETLDARDQRLPEMFQLLTELVQDPQQAVKFRSACLIHLQGWRGDPALAEQWLHALHRLLADEAAELRLRAAEALLKLTESVDSRRGEWIAATLLVLRDRLLAEGDAGVLRALVEGLQNCGGEPQMPEKAIGALRWVLGEIGTPVPPEHQFRIEPLLDALATIGADPNADRGQWLGACEPLLQHRKRQSLRLILQSHAAADLARDIQNPDGVLARRAREAMELLVATALLKPAREPWTGSEELLREARDVRTAFTALDRLEGARLVEPAHLLLRLEVDLAAGRHQEVVQRAVAWLADGGSGGAAQPALLPDDRDRVRLLAAEAQLALGRAELARKLVEERAAQPSSDPASLDLETRIARALVATDLAGAVELFGRVMRATLPDDPALRSRLLDWMQHRVRLDPTLRADTLRAAAPHAALFRAADCPPDQREAWDQLHSAR